MQQAETRPVSLSCSPSLNAYASSSHVLPTNCSHCSDQPTAPLRNRQRCPEAEQDDVKDDDDVGIANNNSVCFEFSFDCAEAVSSPISADQIFHNGKIKPIYSVDDQQQPALEDSGRNTRRKPLRRLFIEEKRHSCSSSESSDDGEEAAACTKSSSSELESVPSETYCVWKPKTAPSKEIKKAEGSSSKRWKLKDLLLTRRSSERENNSNKKEDDINDAVDKKKAASNNKKKNEAAFSPQQQQQPELDRKMGFKETGGEKRRSYLPYRQELVGIFGNNGSGRNLMQRF